MLLLLLLLSREKAVTRKREREKEEEQAFALERFLRLALALAATPSLASLSFFFLSLSSRPREASFFSERAKTARRSPQTRMADDPDYSPAASSSQALSPVLAGVLAYVMTACARYGERLVGKKGNRERGRSPTNGVVDLLFAFLSCTSSLPLFEIPQWPQHISLSALNVPRAKPSRNETADVSSKRENIAINNDASRRRRKKQEAHLAFFRRLLYSIQNQNRSVSASLISTWRASRQGSAGADGGGGGGATVSV